MSTLQIEQKIRKLPGYLLPEIMDFVDFLLYKHGQPAQQTKTFTFDWEGGLADLSDKYTSVELQHAIAKHFSLKIATMDQDFKRVDDIDIIFL